MSGWLNTKKGTSEAYTKDSKDRKASTWLGTSERQSPAQLSSTLAGHRLISSVDRNEHLDADTMSKTSPPQVSSTVGRGKHRHRHSMENNYSRKKGNLLQTDDATGPVGRWKSEAVEAYRDKAEKIMGTRNG